MKFPPYDDYCVPTCSDLGSTRFRSGETKTTVQKLYWHGCIYVSSVPNKTLRLGPYLTSVVLKFANCKTSKYVI